MAFPKFPSDGSGGTVPVLAVQYGQSVEPAITDAGIAEVQISDGTGALIRVWALGTDLHFKTGVTGLSVAGVVDARCANGAFFDVPVPRGHTHFRATAVTGGSGNVRIEKLG